MAQIRLLAWALPIALTALALGAQEKSAPSRPHPPPQVTGKLVGSDGARLLILQYERNSRSETFIGNTQSACMVPVGSNPAESKQLDLSMIPKRTVLTVFYLRHIQAGRLGKRSENVILAVRFDRLQGEESTLPQGVVIPCVKRADRPSGDQKLPQENLYRAEQRPQFPPPPPRFGQDGSCLTRVDAVSPSSTPAPLQTRGCPRPGAFPAMQPTAPPVPHCRTLTRRTSPRLGSASWRLRHVAPRTVPFSSGR